MMAKKIIINKNPKKEATINDLVVVVNSLSERMDKGFAKVDKQFVEVNDRFTEQEIKMEKMMDEKIEGLAIIVSKSFEKMATKNDVNLLREDMNEKFEKVNNSIEKISIKMDSLADVVYADHRPRIISLENRTQKLESAR